MPPSSDAKPGSLKDELSASLPAGFRCRVRYVHTPSKPCDSLFSAPPGHEPEKTRLASHFLNVSINTGSDEGTPGVVVLGVEALIYSTKYLTTIFISKADSTGYLPQQRPSPAKTITTTFLQWLSARERNVHPRRKLVISLFARSQSQYLFPGSAENPKKHILDDRQLIKWWARVLDPLFPKSNDQSASPEVPTTSYDGYITVPGYSGVELRPFFPPQNPSSGAGAHWKPGNPLHELAETRGISTDAPPRCLLPRFPDDPKARFMQDLDDEVGISEDTTISPTKKKSGKWTSVRDLDRFWEAMEFRQECSSGRVVGFLWLVMRMEQAKATLQKTKTDVAMGLDSQDSSAGALSSDPIRQEEEPITNGSPTKPRRRRPLTGPIVPRQPRLKGGSSSLTATSDLNGMLNTAPEDGIVLTKDGYDKAMQTLLHLDFANIEVATESSSTWASAVSKISGLQSDWSLEVAGMAKLEETAGISGRNGNSQVNDLGGMVRKKRKAYDQSTTNSAITDAQNGDVVEAKPAVNVLSAGMIRKKPKPAT